MFLRHKHKGADSKVRLNETSDSDEQQSEEDKNNEIMQYSMKHLRNIRSRDFSYSTTKSNPNINNRRTPSSSGFLSSNLPSNAVVQESLRKQYDNSGISRKDYSKRTKVSVLDSQLSSL